MKLKPKEKLNQNQLPDQNKSSSNPPANLALLNPNAAGIDIGSGEHWVSVPVDRDPQNVQRFGCFTPDLYALADWLKSCRIETVAMESTGVYWIALFQILESRGFEVKLVNAHFVKTVPGRKSDVLDCQWLQQLHTYGLLAGSFRSDDEVSVLRSYIRQRDNLIRTSSTHVLRMQKALTQMNVQLHKVISDITGVTGLAIIRAIVAGERNPEVLAALKNGRIQRSQTEIAAALTGDYRPEHVFVLQQELSLWEVYQSHIAVCDAQIEQCLGEFAVCRGASHFRQNVIGTIYEPLFSRQQKGYRCKSGMLPFAAQVDLSESPLPPPKRRQRNSGNAPDFDLRTHLYRISGADFTHIDGLGVLTVQTILSEVGLDPTRFPTVKHFTSWLGLCPGSRITGGKVKISRALKVEPTLIG